MSDPRIRVFLTMKIKTDVFWSFKSTVHSVLAQCSGAIVSSDTLNTVSKRRRKTKPLTASSVALAE